MNCVFQQIRRGQPIALNSNLLASLNLWEKTQFTKGDDVQHQSVEPSPAPSARIPSRANPIPTRPHRHSRPSRHPLSRFHALGNHEWTQMDTNFWGIMSGEQQRREIRLG